MSLGFDWTYLGLDRSSESHSLAEPSFLSDVVLDQNWNTTGSEDGYASSSDTHVAQQISSSEHETLEQKSLDCSAEFAAIKKGGRAVACTAMAETEDSVTTLWIARNNGFEDADYSMFGRLAKLYDLRMTKEIKQLLHDSASAASKSKRLWVNICRLARIRIAIERFKDIILALPSLKKVSINLIPCPLAPQGPSEPPISLDQTTTLKAVLGRGWTLDKTGHEFFKQQKQKYNIHTKVQMLMYLTAQSSSRTSYFPYFGITPRGSPGRLFKPWTVPHAYELGPDQARRVSLTLVSMQKKIESTLMAEVKSHMQLERTSAFGGTSIMERQQSEPSQRQLHISWLTMIAERERVLESFRRGTDQPSVLEMHGPPIPREDAVEGECHSCPRLTSRKCSLCGQD
ncbi:hypothetical protein HBH64_206630 [Parastagonospora nodorum]|nr:hypothetical protein HBH48_241610 [Parastagonospora nodorum]KAH4229594.1 hypothetical protein HBI05_197990 [Parastagonospora nodorum]KAH4261319.1 hypothetical protein HBI04_206600 [Parastagonospora nodorum]KAH4289898.1 hypothetical protein HBI01_208510 [Parastagonospora nodorum]KAH4357878.1 hypothetical protein HBH94_218160 [Parastagonospora nodorum]